MQSSKLNANQHSYSCLILSILMELQVHVNNIYIIDLSIVSLRVIWTTFSVRTRM